MGNFGGIIYSVDCFGWVNDVTWSPTGNFLAAVSQDSQIHIINSKSFPAFSHKIIQWKGRAFYRGCFLTEDCLILCGYDRMPVYYSQANGDFVEKAIMDDPGLQAKPLTYLQERKNVFEVKKLGQSTGEVEYLPILPTKHKNTIT